MIETTLNGQSADILSENIQKLKQIFPEVFCEESIDFEKLQAVLGEYSDDDAERYNFTWWGKSRALRLAQTPSMGTLRPCKEESKDWDTTENLYIEGDNLEVLKLLQKSYHGKVKMIYIDPPYNTGKDFVYKDDYKDPLKHYLEMTEQVDEGGKKMGTNSEASGRYHTNWLNMIYPRLRLARNLLSNDGVIFISIDENEVSNLRKLCDELYGEENLLGIAARVSKKANNQGDYWSPNFDYILTYAKSRNNCPPFFGGVNFKAYNQVDSNGSRKGEKYQPIRLYMTSLDPMRGCSNQRFFIECPDGSFVIPPGNIFPKEIKDGAKIEPQSGTDKVWRWTKERYEKDKESILIKKVRSSNLVDHEGNPANWNVYTKTYLNDVIANSTAKPNGLIENQINQLSSHELKILGIPFPFAKPSMLIKYLCEISKTTHEEIVLDFFSGSGSSAQGVFETNRNNQSSLKFIMVQIPEITEEDSDEFKAGFMNICEIGKERIRRAGEKIKAELKEKQSKQPSMLEDNKAVNPDDLDIGFKVFKLDSSNLKKWNPDYEHVEASLLDAIENFAAGREELDVVYEIMLKYGIDLTFPIEEFEIGGKKIYSIGYGALMICLDNEITTDVANEIVRLKENLKPEVIRVVFKDNGFQDDSVKTNTKEILRNAGIDEIVSI